MHNWLITTESKKVEYYKGLQIYATNGLHEQMLALFQKYVPVGQRILDVGAGAGAFSLRLHDHGYQVVGLDANNDAQFQWKAQGVPFVECDLNKSSLQTCLDQTFDAVCCMEVIEHLENPWQLMRGIKAALRPGGIAIVSTPNVDSFESRLLYLLHGIPSEFGEGPLNYGHINPITTFEMSHIAKSVGLTIQEIAPGGDLPIMNFSVFGPRGWLRPLMWLRPWVWIYNALRLGIYFMSCGQKNGYVTMFVLQNPC